MITFEIRTYRNSSGIWRNGRLLFYVRDRQRAIELARGYVDACNERCKVTFIIKRRDRREQAILRTP